MTLNLWEFHCAYSFSEVYDDNLGGGEDILEQGSPRADTQVLPPDLTQESTMMSGPSPSVQAGETQSTLVPTGVVPDPITPTQAASDSPPLAGEAAPATSSAGNPMTSNGQRRNKRPAPPPTGVKGPNMASIYAKNSTRRRTTKLHSSTKRRSGNQMKLRIGGRHEGMRLPIGETHGLRRMGTLSAWVGFNRSMTRRNQGSKGSIN